MILHGHKPGPSVRIGDGQHLGELPRIHGGGPYIKSLAGADDIIERLQRFLHRRMVIKAVDLIEIDVIGPEAAQAIVDGVADMLAGKTTLVGIVAHRVVDFGGNDHLVPGRPEFLQRPPENGLTLAYGIHVGCIEKVNSRFQSPLDEGTAFGLIEDPFPPFGGAVSHGAETDAGDFEAGLAEVDVFHNWLT